MVLVTEIIAAIEGKRKTGCVKFIDSFFFYFDGRSFGGATRFLLVGGGVKLNKSERDLFFQRVCGVGGVKFAFGFAWLIQFANSDFFSFLAS